MNDTTTARHGLLPDCTDVTLDLKNTTTDRQGLVLDCTDVTLAPYDTTATHCLLLNFTDDTTIPRLH